MKEKNPWKNISFNEEMSKFRDEKSELFKKIIVITHLEALKESFGVAVEVSKNESSSYFSLN